MKTKALPRTVSVKIPGEVRKLGDGTSSSSSASGSKSVGNDHTSSSASGSESVQKTKEHIDDFAVEVGPTVETTAEVMDRLAGMAPPQNLDDLCQHLGLAGAQAQQLKDGVRDGLANASTDLTPHESAALAAANAKITAAAGNAPKDVSKTAQFKNNLVSGTVSWATGFGAAVGLTKGVAAALGKDAIHFIDFAGPFMLLGSEVIAGRFRAQGPGYAAADLAAYTSHDVLCADQRRLGMKMSGVAHSGRAQTPAYAKLQESFDKMTVGRQTTCVGLIRRELGQVLGLKTDPKETDAPGAQSCLLGCLHSQLTADVQGNVSLRDGTALFTYDKNSPKGTFNVTWPDGQVTDLLKAPVPPQHKALFERMESDLVGAARVRSFVADEVTIMTFAGVEALGALGPWVTGTFGKSPGTAAADAVIGVTCAFLGTQVYLHSQNAARSVITGQAPAPGNNRPEQLAKYEKAEMTAEMKGARMQQLAAMHAACKTELAALRQQEKQLLALNARPDPILIESDSESGSDETEARNQKIDDVRQNIRAHEEASAELKKLFRATSKEAKAAKVGMGLASGKLEGTGVGTMESWRTLWNNKPLLASKLMAYTAAFTIYSAAYANFVYSLAPNGGHANTGNFTMPGNITDTGNFTFADSDFGAQNFSGVGNETALGVAAEGVHSLTNFVVANALNATVIAAPYLFKNNVIVRATYNAYSTVAGGVEYLAERLRGAGAPTATVAAQESDDDTSVYVSSGSSSDHASHSVGSGEGPKEGIVEESNASRSVQKSSDRSEKSAESSSDVIV